MPLPMHPEAVADDPATLRWVVPADAVPFTGPVAAAPGRLGRLLADGTLGDLVCEPAGVLITLNVTRSWREAGDDVRGALHEALAQPQGWIPVREQDARGSVTDRSPSAPRPDADARDTDDADMVAAARQALAGSVGDYVRSHGGKVDLVDVRDGIALVRLSGACSGCPASALTIHGRLEHDLLDEIPGLTAVRQAPTRLTLLRALGLGRGG